jgi:hypothetical protein
MSSHRTWQSVFALVAAGSVSACFSPELGSQAFSCGEDQSCPEGFTCALDGLCYRVPPAAPDGGAVLDAAVADAAPGDAAVLDAALPDSGAADAGLPDASVSDPDAEVPPVLNDVCATATPLVDGQPLPQESMTGATADQGASCAPVDSPDLFYSLELASDAAVLVEATPLSPWPLTLALSSGADCANQVELHCTSEDASLRARRFNLPTLAAGSYRVSVAAASGPGADFEIGYQTRAADSSFGYWEERSTVSYQGLSNASSQLAPLGDDAEFTVDLPFSFPYFGTAYTQVFVSSNGFVAFDNPPGGNASSSNDCPLNNSAPFTMAAAFWDDLVPVAQTSQLRFEVTGQPPQRRATFEWVDWDIKQSGPCGGPCSALGARVTHKITLEEQGDIVFDYGPRQGPGVVRDCGEQHLGCSASVGLRNPTGTDLDDAGCNVSQISEGLQLRYIAPTL